MSELYAASILRICPSKDCPCREKPGYVEARRRGDQIYYYFVHYWKEGGKRRIHKCYLGAHRYKYVEPFNPLGLAGELDRARFIRYLRRLLEKLTPEQKQWLKEEVMKLVGQSEGG